jgi:ribonuclease VapC
MPDRVYLDASVLVAFLLGEEDWLPAGEIAQAASRICTSAVSIVEAVMVASSRLGVEPAGVEERLRELFARHSVAVLSIDEVVGSGAVRAFARYGKGRHPARLNLGDCFSYACAGQHRLTLLYKGNDFAQTDLG